MLNKYYQPGCDFESLEIRNRLSTFKRRYGKEFEKGNFVGSTRIIKGKKYVVVFVRLNYEKEPYIAEVRLQRFRVWKRKFNIKISPHHVNCRCVVME